MDSPHSTAALACLHARPMAGSIGRDRGRSSRQLSKAAFSSTRSWCFPMARSRIFSNMLSGYLTSPPTSTRLQLLRSTDRGLTWSTASNAVTMTPLYRSNGTTLVVNPKTQHFVQDPTNPSFAVDSRNGSLYAVWEDGRFSNFQHNDIAFSMSSDGGLTWSAPVRVNQTPVKIPVTDRQAFHPSVAVGRSGTIGISYYDFRFNNANASMATDRWLVLCRPSSARAASDSACWDTEVRLTTNSFNMEAVVPIMPFGSFLGDYFGLDSAGDNFVAVFAQPDDEKVTSVFARRIEY